MDVVKLRDTRISIGFTQTQLAERLQISQQSYSRYESGLREPDHATLVQLSEILGVTTDYLLGKSDIPTMNVSVDGVIQAMGINDAKDIEAIKRILKIASEKNKESELAKEFAGDNMTVLSAFDLKKKSTRF